MSNQAKSRIFMLSVLLCVVLGVLCVRSMRIQKRLEGELEAQRGGLAALEKIGPGDVKEVNGKIVGKSGDTEVEFTIDPTIQRVAEKLLQEYDPVTGAVVAIDSRTGAVLGMAAYARKRKDFFRSHPLGSFLDPVLRNSNYPLASIVKIVTASAAIEKKGMRPESGFDCAGYLRVGDKGVGDPAGERHGSLTMADAFAYSCNPTFGAIGLRVGRKNLEEYFDRYQFNHILGFDMPLLESWATVGEGRYALAATGAGFEGARVSPVHAAMIAATMQNRGVMMRPFVVREVREGGAKAYEAKPAELATPVKARTAEAIARMMVGTVKKGTARKGFLRGGMSPEKTDVVGKTGSLNDNGPKENFTWFVGFHKNSTPFALAVMIMNDEVWKIRAASFSGVFFKNYLYEHNKNSH